MNPKLEVRDTKKYGKGVFTRKNIKKGELLAAFGGFVMTLKEEAMLPEEFQVTAIQISDDLVLGSGVNKEDVDYLNHSCNPNSGIKGQVFLVAMRDIKEDEEVTFDYATTISKSKAAKLYRVKCLCGTVECRGYVTNNDWNIPELQKKYDGYFQWYLQEKINKMKHGR